jgi:hypothetical protein
MSKTWVDPWSCTLVDKTPDMFWGNLILDQVVVGVCSFSSLPGWSTGPRRDFEGGHDHMRDVSHMQ